MGVGRQGQSARPHARLSLGTFNLDDGLCPSVPAVGENHFIEGRVFVLATVGGHVPPSARCHQTVFWLTFYVTNQICRAT